MLRIAPAALVAVLTLHTGASAQFAAPPPYGDPGYGGMRFSYYRSGLSISGTVAGYGPSGIYIVGPGYGPFLAPPPYAAPKPRVIVNNYYGTAPLLGTGYSEDTRGYDLDAAPPKKTVALAEPAVKPAPAPVAEMPGVDVSVPKMPVRPEDVAPAPKNPEPKPAAKVDMREDHVRLVDLGLEAFGGGEYGLAAQRFRQAIKVTPDWAKADFLLGQAEFALGKYREAAATIQAGMKLDKRWPHYAVLVRADIYKDSAADFPIHLKQLETALAEQPTNTTLLFLLGHQLWFDGRRADALAVFQRARPLTKNTAYLDAFLAAGGPGQIAAN